MSESPTTQHTVKIPNSIPMVSLLGPGDGNLKIIEDAFRGTEVHVRGDRVTITGHPAEAALLERLLDELVTMIRTGQGISGETVERSISILREETQERPAEVLSLNILSNRGRTIRPKTLNQKRYVDAIDKHTIVFGIGPAGTGKTYLAMALCTTCSIPSWCPSCWPPEPSRSPRWRTCGGAPSTTRSSSSTRRRTPRRSR
jgi:phosphate starvation-inducible PhoH-like protein